MANPSDFEAEQTQGTNLTESEIESLGMKLRNQFHINETFRWQKEQEWLQSLRQFNGMYDPEDLKKIAENRSKVYPKITRSKCISVKARLHEICFPDIGKAWSIEPSPSSTISDEGMKAVMAGLLQEEVARVAQEQAALAQSGATAPMPQPALPSDDKVQLSIQKYAKERCAEMEIEIDDQLLDTKYEDKAKDALLSGLLLGTGVIKGPMVEYRESKRWKIVNGQYALDKQEIPRPYLEFVRLWDIYPDMSVTNPDEAEGIFQRHVMTKHEVRKLSYREDFNADAIYRYLAAHPDGDCGFKDWELQLQALNAEDGELRKGRKYEVLEYWGYVDARDLSEVGVNIPEERQDIELGVNIWLLGPFVIKAVLNSMPKEISPYHWFYFEKDESSIFGRGLPRIMRDTQITIAAAARLTLDNAAICAGPQVEINTDLMDPSQDFDNIYPWKIWIREGRNVEAQYPALRAVHLESHIEEYLKIIELFMNFGDLETAFPTYMLIEPQKVGNETAQGASLRHGTVNITVKDIAKNIDQFQAGIIADMYAWNMEFSDREDIKGDYTVRARGLSSLIAKEVRMAALTELNMSLTPDDIPWIKRNEFLKERFKVSDLPPEILRTEEEYDEYIKQTTDPRVIELQVQKLAAEVEKMKATSLSNVARAKKTNIEAMELAAGGGNNAGE